MRVKHNLTEHELFVLMEVVHERLMDEVGRDIEYGGVSHYMTNLKKAITDYQLNTKSDEETE